MRQRGAYVATETPFVNPHSQEISGENIDCDKEGRQGAPGARYVKLVCFATQLCANIGSVSLPSMGGRPPPGKEQPSGGTTGEISAEDLHGSAGG
jgi:hypothetical protein